GQLGQSNQASVLEAKQAPAIQADAGKSNAADQVVRQPYPERYPDRYVLQAGAYSQSENADAQVARLKKLGVKVYTDRIKTPKGERVRVRVGPFANKADAVKVQTKLRQAQIETALAGPDA
ncbi:MAG: SPOR domain-containing protein, partial [Betaproteobacteria bacterium]|nr:SPOR domain-containing protein [Betaproteobacteria bacterium]